MENDNTWEYFERFLRNNNCSFDQNLNIKYQTYFKTGGNVKFFLRPDSIEEFILVRKYLIEKALEYKVIGFTTNTLFLDEVEYSIIISTKSLTKLELKDNIIEVETGYSLQDFVRVAVIHQAGGFEGLEGIPASIGGAVFMNAGAYGSCISDYLIKIKCLDERNNIVFFDKNECNFSYRKSIFKTGEFIILSVFFEFKKGNANSIAKNIETYHIARHSYQEFAFPTLGSMISMEGDPYLKIMNKDKFFVFSYWVLKYLYKNPLMKLIARKRPNNIVFNNLLTKFLKTKKGINLKYDFSIKNVNILKNDGNLSSKELTDYIFLIHELVEKKYHIENEIIVSPVYSVNKNFIKEFNSIKKKIIA